MPLLLLISSLIFLFGTTKTVQNGQNVFFVTILDPTIAKKNAIYGKTQTENRLGCSKPLKFDVTDVESCLDWGAAVTAKMVKLAKKYLLIFSI